MKKKLLLSIFALLICLSSIAQNNTYTGGATGNWNVASNWSTSNVPTSSDNVIIPTGKTVTINVDAVAKSVSVSGTLYLDNSFRLTVGSPSVNGNFTVNSPNGIFKINNTGTLIVYGNYANNGTTDFWKGTVVITGDLSSPATSEIQNNGNVIVGGNIIGNFDTTGGSGNNQIYAVNPNAIVDITPATIDSNVIPGSTVEPGLIDIVNTVIFGGTCPFNVNSPSDRKACAGTNTTFAVTTDATSPTCQWQINTGSGWSDLTDSASYSGVTTLTLTITGITTAMDGYQYRAKITGNGGCVKNGLYGELIVGATNTWNGTNWSSGTAPTGTEKIVFAGNYSSSSDISGCSCQVNSGNIVINSGNTLAITDALTVAGGSLTFENNSSLLQTNASAVNSGNIIYKRKTTPLKQYDYTYWSSPVANATLSQLATNSLFYSFNPSINNWAQEGGSTTMALGKGYIGRAPNYLDYSTSQTVETNFTGTPNNGNITTPIVKGTGILNLIGNPYPSAIDIDLFLTDAANSSILDGTIYLWTHNTAISSSIPGNNAYNYTVNDYAKYNLTGGVKTASAAISGGTTPTGKIAAGQGFFIDANSGMANGNYTATFRNSMRVSGNNNQFFRNSSGNNDSNSATALEKHRIWVSLSNTQGAYNEALVGYIQNATNGLDRLFDGKTLPSENTASIYSMLADEKLSIQGRALPFANTDIIPIGYTTSLNGDFTINLENFDGLFDNQNIYLFDNATGMYHDLKVAAFTFTTTSGVFNNRFELRFTNQTLSVDTQTNNTESLIVLTKDKAITVKSAGSNISSIEVRDLLGKLVYSQDTILSKEFRINDIQASSQVLIVKVTLDNKQTIVKKALMP